MRQSWSRNSRRIGCRNIVKDRVEFIEVWEIGERCKYLVMEYVIEGKDRSIRFDRNLGQG